MKEQSHSVYIASPFGEVAAVSDGEALVSCGFSDRREDIAPETPENGPADAVLSEARRWLEAFFSGKDPGPFSAPIRIAGTAYRRAVLEELLRIPRGETLSYGEVARRAAARTGGRPCARAAGKAVHNNPVAFIIPCHRVIREDGSLGGYAWGKQIKRALLDMEKR